MSRLYSSSAEATWCPWMARWSGPDDKAWRETVGVVGDQTEARDWMSQAAIFVVLTALVTMAFSWVIWPLFGPIFWAVTIVIVLYPLFRMLLPKLGNRRNLAALSMTIGILLLIIVPVFLIVAAVLREAATLIAALQSGEINLDQTFRQLLEAIPAWLKTIVTRMGLADLTTMQDGITVALSRWLGENAPAVVSVGRITVGFFVGLGVMLYLVFFLLRDGEKHLARIETALPMEPSALKKLLVTFTLTVRATVRGDILTALIQGALGGLAFWVLEVRGVILWTVLMAFSSLFPVFGAALIWVPIAVYFLVNEMIWQGIVLLFYGSLIISLIDNIVRPRLVGQATRMPDYVVLISTLGGIATFGMQGFITGPVVAAMFLAVWTALATQAKQ